MMSMISFPCSRGAAAPAALAGSGVKSCFASNSWNIVGMILEFVIALVTNAFFFSQFSQAEICKNSGPYFGYGLSIGLVGIILALWSTVSVYCHYLLNKHESNPDEPIVPRFMQLSNQYPRVISLLIFIIMLGDYLGHIADVVSGFIMLAAFANLDLTSCALQAPFFLGLVLIAAITSVANVRTCLGHLVMESGSKAWIDWMRSVESEASCWKTFISCLKSDGWTYLCLITEAVISVPAYSSLYANILEAASCFWSDAEPGSGAYFGYTLDQLIFGLVLGVYSTSYAYSQSRINSQSKDVSQYAIQGFSSDEGGFLTPEVPDREAYADAESDSSYFSEVSLSPLRKIILIGSVGGTVGDLSAGLGNIARYLNSDRLPCWGRVLLMAMLIPLGLVATVATLWTCYQALLKDQQCIVVARATPDRRGCGFCFALRDAEAVGSMPTALDVPLVEGDMPDADGGAIEGGDVGAVDPMSIGGGAIRGRVGGGRRGADDRGSCHSTMTSFEID